MFQPLPSHFRCVFLLEDQAFGAEAVDASRMSWSQKPKNRQGINALNFFRKEMETRSSWLNCALRDDEAVYWVRIGPYEALAFGN